MSSEVEPTTLAILFADVVGSTKLYEMMGDARAQETVAGCIAKLSQATVDNQGEVVKTMGDEIMTTFEHVDQAAQAACDMQNSLSLDHQQYDMPIAIRVGFHYGAVVREDQDVFGSAVHVANRLTHQAKGAQILTTGHTMERLSADWKSSSREIDITVLRGQTDEVQIYELLWQHDETTRMMPAFDWKDQIERKKRLRLSYRGKEVVVSDDVPSITIGRAEDSDLVIKDGLISRYHARIDHDRGKFLLVDQSTNGTCVRRSDGTEQFVRRDSIAIQGEGAIGLGRVPQADSPQAIYFFLEEA